jgi:hypothetical protein
MKKVLSVLSAGLLLGSISCNGSGDKTEAAGNDAAKKNIELVGNIQKAVETGDVSKLGDYIAADAIDHSGPKGDIVGLDSIKAAIAFIHTTGDNMKTEVIKRMADSTHVMEWIHYTGTVKIPMSPGAPVGSQYDMSVVHVTKVANGKAVEHWEFMLPSDMMKMSAPPARPMDGKMEEPKK